MDIGPRDVEEGEDALRGLCISNAGKEPVGKHGVGRRKMKVKRVLD